MNVRNREKRQTAVKPLSIQQMEALQGGSSLACLTWMGIGIGAVLSPTGIGTVVGIGILLVTDAVCT